LDFINVSSKLKGFMHKLLYYLINEEEQDGHLT